MFIDTACVTQFFVSVANKAKHPLPPLTTDDWVDKVKRPIYPKKLVSEITNGIAYIRFGFKSLHAMQKNLECGEVLDLVEPDWHSLTIPGCTDWYGNRATITFPSNDIHWNSHCVRVL